MAIEKRDFLGYLALAFLAAAGLFALYYLIFAPQVFRIAVPNANSEPAQLFSAMASSLRRDHSRIRLHIRNYDSSEDIVRALEAGDVDLAVARSDYPLPRSSLGVAQVQEMLAYVLTRPEAKIDSFAALKGKKVGELTRINSGAGIWAEFSTINRLAPGDLQIKPLGSPSAVTAALKAGELDALLVVAPRGARNLGEILRLWSAETGALPRVLNLSEAKAVAARVPAVTAAEVPAGEMSAQPALPAEAVQTVTFPVLLVVRQKMDSNAVQDLTRELFNVRNALVGRMPAASRLTSLDTERGATFAVHPGAATYYDASETSFLDRYSDLLWLALFGLSSVISAAVWFMSRLFPKERNIMRADHDELLAMLGVVRTANDPAALDAAEKRIDEIVAEISRLSFAGTIDDTQRPAFDILIERIEKVIETRRSTLRS